ncbi:restriction endonuclease subunit S [Actinobacillus genomosp. 1]|nr:restriction endonuclease subunit S [Actinobacillus genomosp. 1]WGE35472.1 restriction endonuclease subunit S [Actinobacillus genomosp. 1]
MKAQQLKNAILQLAIQGKLVPQDPSDEPASVLLDKIKQEKDRLIAEGKIKKSKKTTDNLPSTELQDFPFEIPESWVWINLETISLKLTDGTHNSPPNFDAGDFLYITAKNIKRDGLDLSKISYVSTEIHEEIYSRCNPEKGDILYIKDGATTGISIINPLDIPFSMLSSVALIKTPHSINNDYLNYVMNSHYFYNVSIGSMSGTGIPRITLTKLATYLIPLPHSTNKNVSWQKLKSYYLILNNMQKKKKN